MAERRKILDDLFDAFTITAGANYVSLYDVKGKMTRYSKAAVDLFGLPDEYIPDGTDDWVDYVHPEDRSRYISIMNELLAGDAHTYNLTYRVRMRDGDYGLFRFLGAILRDNETGLPELVGGTIVNEGLLENTDSVTVLRNQYGFLQDLETALGLPQKQYVLYLGISGMAGINERYGYGFGNSVLQQVGWIIQENAAKFGTVYRMEGPKFAVLTDAVDVNDIAKSYENVRQLLLGGISVDGVRVTLTVNGALISTSDTKLNTQSVLSCLRQAYSESKLKRHGKLVDFDGNLGTAAQGDLKLIDTIRSCIIEDCKGFTLAYQPTFILGKDKPIGVEALLRFSHEDYGDIEPSRYVPVLERDYIFEELGFWVLTRAMEDGLKFIEKNPDFILGINIAPAQIEDDFFIEEVRQTADELNFPLKNLCLELTKDCRILDSDLLKDTVDELKKDGVRFIIDDFGTGAASIDFLRDLLPDFIKFDMKYIKNIVQNEEDRQIVKHLSELAVACGTEVCVKGVETKEIYDIIAEDKVRVVQGYYFDKALPADELLTKI